MADKIELGGIAVDVVKKDIKNVHLSVYPPTGKVRISAPRRMISTPSGCSQSANSDGSGSSKKRSPRKSANRVANTSTAKVITSGEDGNS